MPHIHDLYDFTASAFILHPTQPKILLLKHKKIGKWLQPGGHIELNENPLQALHHDPEKEPVLPPADYKIIEPANQPQPVGGTNSVLPLPFYLNEHNFNKTHKHIDMSYLARAKVIKVTDSPDGASAIGWFNSEEIQALFDAGDMFTDTLQICVWIFKKYY